MLRFVDLFAGLGGFHLALSRLGATCVFASELDDELREVYRRNFPSEPYDLVGDIRQNLDKVPPHDILCAGFPCQAFSKSGFQMGTSDPLRGTLHFDILAIVTKHLPRVVLLENVGNFERHDEGRTWASLRARLVALGYHVESTGHRMNGGSGLVSPHHIGLAQNRERFYVVATRFPFAGTIPRADAVDVEEYRFDPIAREQLTATEQVESALSDTQMRALELWSDVVDKMHSRGNQMPSFPVWSDEFGAVYPFEGKPPSRHSALELQKILNASRSMTKQELLESLPSYARAEHAFPSWKRSYIRRNRDFYVSYRSMFSKSWLTSIRKLPASYRKLEWNNRASFEPMLEQTLQFRPSGIRVSAPGSYPTIVAMSSQLPVIGRQYRHLCRREALTLQGFPSSWITPRNRNGAFKAIGNAVHSAVVYAILADVLACISLAA